MKDDSTVTMAAGAAAAPGAEPGALEPGQQVGHYVVGERLGKGGFGEVWRARHDAIARDVAIKVLHAKYSRDATAVARFVAEAKAANTVDHPNIVQVFDFGALPDGRSYFVMELLRGQSLKQLLAARGALPLAEAMPILRAIAEAIDAAHAVGLAHRDLKPDNVFVLADGRVKVIDFGLVKLVGDATEGLTETGVIAGTPLYMSPEQFRGKDIGLATDAYSFGALAYHVLVGEPPFVAKDAIAVGLMHVQDAPAAPSVKRSGLDADVDRWVLALLAKDPDKRPASLVAALGLAPALEAIGTSSTIVKGQVGGIARSPHRARRVAWFGIFAIFAAGALWFGLGHHRLAIQPPLRIAIRTGPVGVDATAPERQLSSTDVEAVRGAVGRMVGAALRAAPGRRYWVVDESPDVVIDVNTTIDARLVTLEATRDGHVIAAARAVSVKAAVTSVVPALALQFSIGRAEAPADAEEAAGMVDVHAPSIEAFRRYRRIVDEFDRSWWVSTGGVLEQLQQLIADYPRWVRAYVVSCIVRGRVRDVCQSELAGEAAHADPTTDPLGHALLELVRHDDLIPVPETLTRWPEVRRDSETAVWLSQIYAAAQRTDDAIALLQELYRSRPDLQFGQNLIYLLRLTGRTRDADVTADEWASLRPEAEQAILARIVVEGRRGEVKAGRAALQLRRIIVGEDRDAWAALCDVSIELGDLPAARHFVDLMLAGDPSLRANGRFRGGLVAMMDGRFSVAKDTFERAAVENKPLGTQSHYTQTLMELLAMADAFGVASDAVAYLHALRETGYFGPSEAAALDFEIAVRSRRPGQVCPSYASHLASVPEGVERTNAQRRLRRVAAQEGCVPCREAIEAGMSETEWSPRSLVSLGACAEHEHDLSLARIAYARALELNSDVNEASLFESTRAAAHLASVLRQLGDGDGARHHAQLVITRWGAADRSLPELDLARKTLAALDAK